MPNSRSDLEARLAGTPYDAYVYAYPHKTAYGPLAPAVKLEEAWSNEDKRSLFLYVHVPFCEMRCGFCNLFTTPRPAAEAVEQYLGALEAQARATAEALGPRRFARLAFGGGTPTLLDEKSLGRVLDLCEALGADPRAIPASVETSPETCLPERLMVLRDRGVDRISIGVQSFLEEEAALVNRPQKNADVVAALDAIRNHEFPTLNVDLIYGLPGQTERTWERSLRTALEWSPEEIYLYPLYVRPVTTLSKKPRDWDDQRLALYRFACTLLADAGYDQVSMRMFQKRRAVENAPVYCVQDDGMVGLGPGARSYTRSLHYSTEWAVGARGVQSIIAGWASRTDHSSADWGITLDVDEQRRRWLAYSLFAIEGVSLAAYEERFGGDLLLQMPFLADLVATGAAERTRERLRLTPLGLERSDTIGPWLYSENVRARMLSFDWR